MGLIIYWPVLCANPVFKKLKRKEEKKKKTSGPGSETLKQAQIWT